MPNNDIPMSAYEAGLRTMFLRGFEVKEDITEKIESQIVASDAVELKKSTYPVEYDLTLPEMRVGSKKYDRISFGEVSYNLHPYQKGIKLTQEEMKFTEYSFPLKLKDRAMKLGKGFNMLTQLMIEDLILNAGGAATSLNWSVPKCYDGYELFSASHRATNIITATSGTSYTEDSLIQDIEEIVTQARTIPLKRNTDRKFFGGMSNYKLLLLVPSVKAIKFERVFMQTTIPMWSDTATQAYGTARDNIWKGRVDIVPMGKLTGNNYYAVIIPSDEDLKPFMKLKWKSDSDSPEFVEFNRVNSESAYEGDYYKMSWEKWFAVVPYFWECIYKVVKT